MGSATLYGIGYSGYSSRDFVRRLRDHEIDVVIDVRRLPLSRKRGFSKTSLGVELRANGISYFHNPLLGVPNDLRAQLKAGLSLVRYLDLFDELLCQEKEAVAEVYALALEGKCCLMCVESDADQCHRSIVMRHVTAYNGTPMKLKNI